MVLQKCQAQEGHMWQAIEDGDKYMFKNINSKKYLCKGNKGD